MTERQARLLVLAAILGTLGLTFLLVHGLGCLYDVQPWAALWRCLGV